MAVKNGQRIFIWVIVITFFASSLGFSGIVIWDQVRNKDETASSKTEDVQKQLEEQLKNQENKEGGLKGTKLEGYTPVASVEALQMVDLTPGTGAEVAKGRYSHGSLYWRIG